MAKKIVLFLVCYLATSPAHAAYSMEDLKALIKAENFAEGMEHLDDIAPSQRLAEWESVSVQTAAGYMKQALSSAKADACRETAVTMRTFFDRHSFIKKNSDIAKQFAAVSSCAYKKRSGYYSNNSDDLLTYAISIYPPALYQFAIVDDHYPTKPAFWDELAKDPKKYAKDEAVKKFVRKEFKNAYSQEDREKTYLPIFKALGLENEACQEAAKEVSENSANLRKGDFRSYSSHWRALGYAHRNKCTNPADAAIFYVANVALGNQDDVGKALAPIQALSPKQRVAAQKEFAAIKGLNRTWFRNLLDSEPAVVKKAIASVDLLTTIAKTECEELLRRRKGRTDHVDFGTCEYLFEKLR